MNLNRETGAEQQFSECVYSTMRAGQAGGVGNALSSCANRAYNNSLPPIHASSTPGNPDVKKLFGPLGSAAQQLLGPQRFGPQHITAAAERLGPGGVQRISACDAGADALARQVMYGPGGLSQTFNNDGVSGLGRGCR